MAADKVFVLDSVWGPRVKQMWYWQRNLAVRGDATCQNTETNCTITVSTTSQNSKFVAKDPIVRIAGNLTGQGKYDGYLLPTSPPTDSLGTNTGSLTNVFLDTTLGMVDGEQVIVWNSLERDIGPSAPRTGTNITHLLPTNTVIVQGRFWGSELVESSTNRRRVVLVEALPSFGCS